MHESPESDPNSESAGNSADHIDDLAQLRERLAFYESFDQLIQENISRAGALLREAAARKSEGELALRSATAEFEKQQLAERTNYRKIFSGLLDEVTTVQQNVERLARQVADALDDLEARIPAAGEAAGVEGDQFPSMPSFSAGSAGELAPGQAPTAEQPEAGDAAPADSARLELEDQAAQTSRQQDAPPRQEHEPSLEPVDELVTPDEAQYDPSMQPDADTVSPGSGAAPTFSEVVQASVERVSLSVGGVEPGPETAHDIAESTGLAEEPAAADAEPIPDQGLSVDLEGGEPEPEAAVDTEPADVSVESDEERWVDEGLLASTTVLVHGVPRATTALSLKRYLEGLAQVHSVEPREYAEGVLRLQVSSDRPVGLDDLRGWPEAADLDPVSVQDDFVEVRLGH